MSRLLVIYLIFIILYSFLKGKKKEEEAQKKAPSPVKWEEDGEEAQKKAPSPVKWEEDGEEELDIFSLPLEEEQERPGSTPLPSKPKSPPPRKRDSPAKEKVFPEPKPLTYSSRRQRIGEWKRGIVMAEVLGPPRSRRSYLPLYRSRS